MLADLQKALTLGQKVQITVWHPQDEKIEHTFTTTILEVVGHLLKVSLPLDVVSLVPPLLEAGMVVGAVIETYPKPVVFYPAVQMRPGVPAPLDTIWLKVPDEGQINTIQRRKHVRVPMVIPFNMEYLIAERWIPLSARTVDVSGGGLRFCSVRLFLMGQELRVWLPFGDGGTTLTLRARVVYSTQNRIKKQPEDIYVTSCQFLDLDDTQEMALVRECFRRELRRTQ